MKHEQATVVGKRGLPANTVQGKRGGAESFRPMHELALVATDGQHLALMPSLGLFYQTSATDTPEQLIHRTRIDQQVVELTPVDNEQRLQVDLLRLTRMMPQVIGELVQMMGWQRARALLGHRLRAVAEAHQLAKGYGILAHNAVVPGGWLDGMSEPLGSLPLPSELPRVLVLELRFADTQIKLVARREALFARLEAALKHGPFDPREGNEPCFLAVVGGPSERATSFADLEPADVRALGEEMEREQTGSFEALVCDDGDNDGDEVDPELAPTVELRRLSGWSARELRELLATAQAMTVQRHGDPRGYLERVLGSSFFGLDPAELDAEAAPVLAQLLNLWAVTAIREGDAARAVTLLEVALACSPPADVLQELRYNRGRALLRATLPASATEGDELDVTGYPTMPRRRDLECWQQALDNLAAAASLDEADFYAWARAGIAALLLGSRGDHLTVRRRIQLLRQAEAAIEHALAGGSSRRNPLEAAQQSVRGTLAELSKLPWYRRAFGRHRPISDSMPEAKPGETGPQLPQRRRRR